MAEIGAEKLLSEMDQFLTDEAQNNAAEAAADDALPFESIDDYSTAPVDFSEMTVKMMHKVDAVFDLAVKYNRHSSRYLKTCTRLEKGISYLARCCRTKYVLENHKHVFPELEQLSTEKLYRMASFHFRKIDRALTEYMEQKQDISDELLDMQFRFFNLLDRLRATEVRIYHDDKNRYADNENPDLEIHGKAFSSESRTRWIHQEHKTKPAAFNRAAAFSLLKDTLAGVRTSDAGSTKDDTSSAPQDSDTVSQTPSNLTQQELRKQAMIDDLEDDEKAFYEKVLHNPELLADIREKSHDVYYCCDHLDEARIIMRVLSVIDSG